MCAPHHRYIYDHTRRAVTAHACLFLCAISAHHFYSTEEVSHKASGYGLKHSGYGEIDIRLDMEEELKLYMALRDPLAMIQSPDVVQRGQ